MIDALQLQDITLFAQDCAVHGLDGVARHPQYFRRAVLNCGLWPMPDPILTVPQSIKQDYPVDADAAIRPLMTLLPTATQRDTSSKICLIFSSLGCVTR